MYDNKYWRSYYLATSLNLAIGEILFWRKLVAILIWQKLVLIFF